MLTRLTVPVTARAWLGRRVPRRLHQNECCLDYLDRSVFAGLCRFPILNSLHAMAETRATHVVGSASADVRTAALTTSVTRNCIVNIGLCGSPRNA